jgi:thymidylate kinase
MSKISSTLRNLSLRNIEYVSWKNNHQLSLVFSGRSDLDIFIHGSDYETIRIIMNEAGWLETFNPVANFKNVYHFQILEPTGTVWHIHVYLSLITGESWLKEYDLPLGDWLIANRIWCKDLEIWILNSNAQAYVFYIRHLLKNGSFFSRLLYHRELKDYRDEFNYCDYDTDIEAINFPIRIDNFSNKLKRLSSKFYLPFPIQSIWFRLSLLRYMRFSLFSLPIRRIIAFSLRLKNKLFSRQKKLVAKSGMAVCLTGGDGSGKSTLITELSATFGQFLTVKNYHLGRPQGPVIEAVLKLFTSLRGQSKGPKASVEAHSASNIRAIKACVLALMRFHQARKVLRDASEGNLVLVDRWPTLALGKMDGPKISAAQSANYFIRWCRRLEIWAYSKIPEVDLCIVLTVPVSVAVARNTARFKKDKETEKEIVARHKNNDGIQPIAKNIITFDNSGDVETSKAKLISIIWRDLVLSQ